MHAYIHTYIHTYTYVIYTYTYTCQILLYWASWFMRFACLYWKLVNVVALSRNPPICQKKMLVEKIRCHISWKAQPRCFEQLKYFLSSTYVCPDCLFISWSCSFWEPCRRKELSICACCRAVDNLPRRGVSDGERYVCDLSNSSTSWWNLHFCCHLHSTKKLPFSPTSWIGCWTPMGMAAEMCHWLAHRKMRCR